MTFRPDRLRRLMELAVRPEGVTAREVDPTDIGEMTKAFRRLAQNGYGRWEQIAFRLVRYWLTPEEHAAWLETKTPKPKAAPKTRACKPVVLKAAKPAPASTRPQAWWDKNARPHHDTYVEPRITSETKVTICSPRAPSEWVAR